MGRRRAAGLLASLVIGTLLAIVPASPASAIQTVAWTTAPPATATVGQQMSFAWSGTANTFLGARITGCFANFPEGNNYTRSFGGNFTTGNCNIVNRVIPLAGTYQIVAGFTLSNGGQMTMTWNINVAAPTPTVYVSAPSSLVATSTQGAQLWGVSAYGSDAVYGTYGATCTPANGAWLMPGWHTITCSATNGAGKTGTKSVEAVVLKGNPTIVWAPPAAVPAGTRYGDLMTAWVEPSNATGRFTYRMDSGYVVSPNDPIPVGDHQAISVTFEPTGNSVNVFNAVTSWTSISVYQTAQSVTFDAGTPTDVTFGDAAFPVTVRGTNGGGHVSLAVQAGSTCTVGSISGGSSGTAMVSITGAGPCVLLADQAASGQFLAAPTAQWSLTVAKQNSVVYWSTPSPLTFPATFGAVEAPVANVGGTFSYLLDGEAVTTEAVPTAGNHQLTAIFTPFDTVNFTGASVTQVLMVEKGLPVLTIGALDDAVYGDTSVVPFETTSTNPADVTRTSLTPGVCAVGPTSVSVLTAGTCTISVSQAETADYLAAEAVERSFTIAKGTPDLAWITPAPITYGAPLGTAQLNAAVTTPSDAFGELRYLVDGEVADAAVLDAGTHTLQVTWTPFAGFEVNWERATAEIELVVDRAMPPIEWAPPTDITYGTPLGADQLNADIPGVEATFTYQALGGPAAGAILPAGDNFIIVEFQPASPNYLSGSLAVPIHVNKAPQAISFSVSANHTYEDDPFGLIAVGGGSGEPLVFTADGACTVADATVTLIGAGACEITASQVGNDNWLPAPSVTRSVTVDKATPVLTWAPPAGITYGTALGAAQFDASVLQAGATGQVHYYLADGVTPADGAVLHAGDDQTLVATFVPDAQASANYVPVTVTVRIDVAKAAQAIAFTAPAEATYGDADLTISATGGNSGLPVRFTSIGNGCAVNGTTVSVLAAGWCTVTASQPGTDDFLPAAPVEQTIVVAKAAQAVALGAIADRTYGDAPFEIDVTPGASTTPVATSATGDCALVGTTVTITGAGSCTVTADQGSDDNHLVAPTVTRSFAIAKAGQAITFASLGTANFADGSVTAQATGGPSGQPVLFTASGDACDVVGITVFIRHAGTCEVTASQAGDDDHLDASAVTRTLTVTPQVLASGWSPEGLTYGDPIGAGQRNAAVLPGVPGTWTYSVADGDVLAAGTHQLEATFTPDATGDILPVTLSVSVAVDRANQTITFGPVADRTFGDDPFEVSAAGGASGQPVTFSSATDACTTTTGGTVSIDAAGGCTIAADQSGDTNFNAAPTASRSFDVTKALPVIQWAQVDAISFGIPLGDAQLSAEVTFEGQTVPGTLTYGPAAGTVLNASSTPQVLAVTFTPDNTRDFLGASGTTTVLVQRAAQTITLPGVSDTTYGQGPITVSAAGGASGQPVTFTTAGSCSVADTQVTITGAGACTVTADQDGNANHHAAAPVSTTFAIAKAAGTVELAPIAGHIYGDAPFTVTAVNGASTGPVTLSATGSCAVSATGQVSLSGAGECSVVAVHDGDDNHLAASATQSFTVAKAAQALTFEALTDRTYGDAAFALTAIPGASGQPVTFSATGAGCTVAGSTITVVAAGTCSITAAQAGTADHEAATPVARDLVVKPATLTVTATSATRGHRQANPTFAYTVTGFVSGDTASALTTPPTCTTTATTSSPTGAYPVTCSGAVSAKYTFTYKPGTLTVGKVATRLTITNPAIAVAGSTVVSATLTDALTGAPITGELVVLTGDLSIRTAQSNPATATFSFKSGMHVLGAAYFGDANHWPAADAQLLTSYQPTRFVIWGGNQGGVQTGKEYTFFGSQWSKQVKAGTYGGGSSFKGFAGTLNTAGTSWTTPPGSASNPPSAVGDVISVLVSTSITKSGSTVAGNVTKQVLLRVDDAGGYRANGSGPDKGTLLTTL